ncbi:MAG TPA: DUF3617 family protein [Xanthobacteraceae bacterium]|nr:DUF3617 family protein [Xanthobacteraceae bacterium]
MSVLYRITLAAALVLVASAALADEIEPGLWKITTRTETGGVIGPPHESSKCLTAAETKDLATTFSPVAGTVNSICAPIDRSLSGRRLSWRLVCKGQLDMELTGEFNFDSPHHYSGTVRTKAAIAGMPMVDSQNTLEAEWVSMCSQ